MDQEYTIIKVFWLSSFIIFFFMYVFAAKCVFLNLIYFSDSGWYTFFCLLLHLLKFQYSDNVTGDEQVWRKLCYCIITIFGIWFWNCHYSFSKIKSLCLCLPVTPGDFNATKQQWPQICVSVCVCVVSVHVICAVCHFPFYLNVSLLYPFIFLHRMRASLQMHKLWSPSCPQMNGSRNGSKVRQTTWDRTRSTISRKSLILF